MISDCTHSIQAAGWSAPEIATTTTVAPAASTRLRHSRRSANHRIPIPGVTLVRSTNAHVAGQRKPTTIASASSRWMLPAWISKRTIGFANIRIANGPASSTTMPTSTAVQIAWKTGHGSRARGSNAWRKAGE